VGIVSVQEIMPAMMRFFMSCSLVLAACGAGHAEVPTGQKTAPAACSTSEVLFVGMPPFVPGYIAPHNTEMPLGPVYPAALGKNGPSGTVWVHFIVERDGRLCGVEVKEVDGPQHFADITSAWLAGAHFAPALRNGKPVVSEVKRTYDFIPPAQRLPVPLRR
jgi:outer membrane biosynthesis protein TonB